MKVLLVLLLAVGSGAELIDLSHPLDEHARHWPIPNTKRINLSTLAKHDQDGLFIITKYIEMTEHLGTHFDAPHHFSKTAWDLASIPIENFVVPVVKIDVRAKCAADRDYVLTVQDLRNWEAKYGEVPDNAAVLMETGWGDKYLDTAAYIGTDRDQNAADFNYTQWTSEIHFPGFSAELATELLINYTIAGVGTDTISIDASVNSNFEAHVILVANSKFGLENLCCLDKVPEHGATLMVMPPKIRSGTGFTVRVLVDTDSTFAYKQMGNGAFSSGVLILLLLICLTTLICTLSYVYTKPMKGCKCKCL